MSHDAHGFMGQIKYCASMKHYHDVSCPVECGCSSGCSALIAMPDDQPTNKCICRLLQEAQLADVKWQQAVFEVLLNYHPFWLRLGLEIVVGQLLPADTGFSFSKAAASICYFFSLFPRGCWMLRTQWMSHSQLLRLSIHVTAQCLATADCRCDAYHCCRGEEDSQGATSRAS